MTPKLRNIVVRALSGAVYVALILAAILLGNESFYILTLVLGIFGVSELENLLTPGPRGWHWRLARCLDMLAVGFAAMYAAFNEVSTPAIIALAAYLPLRMCLCVFANHPDALKMFRNSAFTVLYIGVPMLCLGLVYRATTFGHPYSWIILATFVLIWVNDTGAFLSGITMGRHPLCPRLSPKKTVEGFVGGILLTIGASLLFWHFQPAGQEHSAWFWAMFGLLTGCAATVGDLFESQIKRTLGVKDSGNLIPGHGGILDRIDSLLLVAPTVAALVAAML